MCKQTTPGFIELVAALVLAMTLLATPAGMAATFSNASLKGPCIWQGLYYPTSVGSAEGAGPVSVVSALVFDGQGNVTLDYDANINGTFSATPNASGNYQVDPNGHGTFTYRSPASGVVLIYDFFITPQGHAIRTMLRTYVGSAVAKRVGNGVCRFDQ